MAIKISSVEADRLRRLQKVEDDIARVNHDIAALDRMAKGNGHREFILKNSRSNKLVLSDKLAEGEKEWLPKIKSRYDDVQGPKIIEGDRGQHPTVVLANYLNNGHKSIKVSEMQRGNSHKGLSELFLDHRGTNHTSPVIGMTSGISQDLTGNHYRNEVDASPKGEKESHKKRPFESQAFQFRQAISPYETTAKALRQKLMTKDAALTSSILMQQKSQHTLNKSIRAAQQIGLVRDRSMTNYQDDDSKKHFFREPQTASTGIYSSGGLTNKIDPVTSPDVRNPSLYSPEIEQFKGSYFPAVSKAGNYQSKDKLRKLSQRNTSLLPDEIIEQEINMKRKSTVLRYSNSSNVHQNPISQEISLEPEIMKGIKLDWNMPTLKLDLSSEFKLEKVLGKGNSSTVYRAYDFRMNTPVAVKILEKSSLKETYLRDMLQKEIDISTKMLHPHLAKLHRVLQDSNKVYIVQEYCGSQTLSQFAEQKKISEAKARSIFKQITSAVNYMHLHGFAHRDLKFSNVLINEYGLVKLVDFGFACEAIKKQRIFCGTPSYMPPELIQKKEYIPMFVDLWSLGVILYKLLTNNYPFGACNDKDLDHRILNAKFKSAANLKPELQKLVDSLLCYQPADRMQTDAILNFVWFKQ